MLVSFEERDRLRREAQSMAVAMARTDSVTRIAQTITDHILNYMETRRDGHSATSLLLSKRVTKS